MRYLLTDIHRMMQFNQPEGQGLKAICFEGRKAGSGSKQYLEDFEQAQVSCEELGSKRLRILGEEALQSSVRVNDGFYFGI